MNCSLPGSPVHGIFQRRIQEWVTIPFSRGSSRPRAQTWGLLLCSQILYHLRHEGSPADRIGKLRPKRMEPLFRAIQPTVDRSEAHSRDLGNTLFLASQPKELGWPKSLSLFPYYLTEKPEWTFGQPNRLRKKKKKWKKKQQQPNLGTYQCPSYTHALGGSWSGAKWSETAILLKVEAQ